MLSEVKVVLDALGEKLGRHLVVNWRGIDVRWAENRILGRVSHKL